VLIAASGVCWAPILGWDPMSTLIRTDEVPAADRLDDVRDITATTWVPTECRSDYRADYQGEFRASGAPAWAWANVFAATVPLMERLGVATREEVDPATLADRLLAETLACDACVIGPPMTSAWTTVPAPNG
jgi:hypothetical protein